MKDQFNTNGFGVRALTRGVRKVAKSSVRIAGDRFGGPCLAGWDGKRIEVSCKDVYGTEYEAKAVDGEVIGHLNLLRG